MKMRSIKRSAAVVLSAALMATVVQVLPLTASAKNYISNSTFESGTSGWGTYKESGGVCSLSTSDGKLALKVSNVGTLNYSVQVFYDILPLYQNGVYRLKYDISCSIDRYAEGMIQQNGGTYQAYTWKGLDLTPTPQTIDYEFTMKEETDIMAKLVFNCGTQGENLPEHTIYLDNVSLELVDDSKVDYSSDKPYEAQILTNQVGYQPQSQKLVVMRGNTTETSFSVVNADTQKVVYTGKLSEAQNNSSANETNRVGDFSEVTDSGKYYITCNGLDDSYQFTISDDAYGSLLDESVKMLYLQRCGVEVKDSVFGHTACHDAMATIYHTSDKIDVSGGWHDAGDYGRYVVPGAKAVADLLYAYDANPQLYSDSIGIPESGNGVPDILDEARFELEWMLKMQASSGGVYHKVSCATFPGYVAPTAEKNELIVTPISTTATADFCASMAMAYEFYQDIDKDFATKCLTAAEKAWGYLENNPNLIFSNPADISTGDYGDTSDKDERYWAAAQLYRATKNEKYSSALSSMIVRTGLDWSTVGDYGNIALMTMDGIDKDSDFYRKAMSAIVNQAEGFAKTYKNNPYGSAISKYNWGSNMTIANAGIVLALAYQVTGDETFLQAATGQLDYLLGKNPLGTCFVTGFGTVAPEHPHHRPSMAANQAMKGMLVGGVNSSLEDSAAKAYCADAPAAKCYVDNSESYSTNEITIYWNSPLTYLLSLTDETSIGSDTVKGDVNADGKCTMADAVALQKYLLGETKSLSDWKAGDVNVDGKLNAVDLTQLKRILVG